MISFILILALIGVGLYLLNTYVPMAAPIKTIINIVVVILVLLWVLESFGILGPWPLHSGPVSGPLVAPHAGPCAPCR